VTAQADDDGVQPGDVSCGKVASFGFLWRSDSWLV